MSPVSPARPPRCGVVDLGSNSVRLVVYEGHTRNPMPIFNEKAVLRLGRGLQETGRLNEDGMAQALMVMDRYRAIAQAMEADPFEVLATAAVREARNGRSFVSALQARLPGVPIRILPGKEEAAYSADGVLCGIPDADGMLADIGGGSLEVVRLAAGVRGESETLPLGVIRLAERSGGDMVRARGIVEADLARVPWIGGAAGRDLYLVGGAWRALARVQLARTRYPLNMVHHYTIGRTDAQDLANLICNANRKVLERLPGVPRRRLDDLPQAGVVLAHLLRVSNVRRVVFSASGLREGWLMRQMPLQVQQQDPMLSAATDMALRLGRDPSLPPALFAWTAPLFPGETAAAARLREAVCWLSDIGSREHPEFRAELAFLRVFRQPGIGLDHHARAFLALAIASRYKPDGEMLFVQPARQMLDTETAHRAEVLGLALRLGYMLSAGTRALLSGSRLRIRDKKVTLDLRPNSGLFAGESVVRRLENLANAMRLDYAVEDGLASAAE